MKITEKDTYYLRDDIKLPPLFKNKYYLDKHLYIEQNNLFHRIDGPAIIRSDGSKEWYINGVRHRIDGPAMFRPRTSDLWKNGSESFYLNGIKVDEEIFRKIQNSSKKELLSYKKSIEYKKYMCLIEYHLNIFKNPSMSKK